MTATNQSDFDRVLAEWLDEGPHRAPDRPIDVAIQHARSHPRRPDPLGFFRAEAMSSRPRYAAALQPAWLLLVLGLLLAGVAAFAVGSSRPTDPVVVPPVATPSPQATVRPTPQTFSFDSVDENGGTVSVSLIDESNLLTSASGGEPMPDGEIPEGASVGVANGDSSELTQLRLVWVGCPSEDTYTVRIDSTARRIVVETAGCTGDTLGVGRTLTLTFAEPVPAGEVSATLVTVP
jgi:hypothetical protein